MIEEVDVHIESLQQALDAFDTNSLFVLESAPIRQELKGHVPDIMPREEVFLISSFLLNLRQAATHVEEMLKHARLLVERHQQRHGRRRVHTPRINWRKWLYTGGDEDERMPTTGRQAARQGHADDDDDDQDIATDSKESLLEDGTEGDLEQGTHTSGVAERRVKPFRPPKSERLGVAEAPAQKKALSLRVRGILADKLDWLQTSEDVLYAFKLTVAVFLVTWPAFHPAWNTWYSLNRGRKDLLIGPCSFFADQLSLGGASACADHGSGHRYFGDDFHRPSNWHLTRVCLGMGSLRSQEW